MKLLRALTVFLALGLSLPEGLAADVLRILVQEDDSNETVGLGSVVSDELVLTTASLVSPSLQVLVEHGPANTRSVAQIRANDSDTDLALLHVPGLSGETDVIARVPPTAGRAVYLTTVDGSKQTGVLTTIVSDEDGKTRYRFTSDSRSIDNGTPLMNNCDQLLGIIQPRLDADEEFGVSGTLPDLVKFLLTNSVEAQIAQSSCPTLQEQNAEAVKNSQRLQNERDALEREKEQLEQSIREGQESSQAELGALEKRRKELAQLLKDKEDELANKLSEAEAIAVKLTDLEQQVREGEETVRVRNEQLEQSREREALLKNLLIAAGAVTAIALVLAGFLMFRRRHHESVDDGPERTQSGSSILREEENSDPLRQSRSTNELATEEETTKPLSVSGEQLRVPTEGEPRTTVAGWHRSTSERSAVSSAGVSSGTQSIPSTPEDPVVGWLVVVNGPGKGSDVVLGSGQNTIGRGKSARVRLDFGDPEISRDSHCLVTYERNKNQFFLTTGTGTNLTYVDDTPVMSPIQLMSCQEFTIGTTTLRFISFCDDGFSWS